MGLNRTALLGRQSAKAALAGASREARASGVASETVLLEEPDPVLALGAAVQGDDLLVIGTPGGQAELGATGRRAVTHVPGTLLIARRPARGGFPGLVGLFAKPSDGLRQAQTARRVAAAFGRGVLTFEDDHGGATDRRRLAERAVAVMNTGVEPVFMSAPGHHVSRLADQVRRSGVGLLTVSRHPRDMVARRWPSDWPVKSAARSRSFRPGPTRSLNPRRSASGQHDCRAGEGSGAEVGEGLSGGLERVGRDPGPDGYPGREREELPRV